MRRIATFLGLKFIELLIVIYIPFVAGVYAKEWEWLSAIGITSPNPTNHFFIFWLNGFVLFGAPIVIIGFVVVFITINWDLATKITHKGNKK